MCRDARWLLPLLALACVRHEPPPKPIRIHRSSASAPAPAPAPASAPAPLPPPPPPPPTPVRLKITIVNASIDPRMSDGKKWDEGPGAKARTATLAGPLAAWLRAHPELEGTVEELGDPVLAPGVIEDARKTDAPDPIAFVSVGERVFRTPLLARSFQPAWGFSFVVEVMPGTSDLLRLDVVDWDGPDQVDAIGTLVLPAAGLVGGQKLRTLPRFGNVASLTMLVEPAAGARLEKRLAVPGKPTWTDTGLDVLAGQTIVIEASGQVCSYNAERCDYPDGQQSPSEANERGFPKLGHAALIGAIADTRFKVGRERRFVAPASGRLFLGVNDRASSDNTGSFDTRIRLGDTLPP